MEKQKSRLQSEVEVLIIDLERANGTARDFQKRVEILERTTIEIRSRLEETIALYETSQRELKNKQVEITRITNELDNTRNQRDGLARENKKLSGKLMDWFQFELNTHGTTFFADENHDARNAYTEITRRYHELEIELRRLENEREELTAAYKEAEAVSFKVSNIFAHFNFHFVF